MKHSTTACEICRANDWETVYMGPVLWGRMKSTVKSAARMCKTCGAIRLDDSMGADEYTTEEYRRKLKEPTDAEGFYETHDKEQIFKLLRINDIPLRGRKVLDVGAAAGAFLDRIRGVAEQVSAIEPCRSYEEALFKKCFEVYPFIQSVAQGRKYDLITCFDTIEHVQDPSATLQAAYRLLSPGGTLLVSTGEYEPLAALARPSTYFRTQHKWYWTDESFWELYFHTIGGPGGCKLEGTEARLECVQEPHGPQMYLYVKKPLVLNG
jgi:SAM-dependent methyltransferase